MNAPNANIDYDLIAKYLAGEASPEELNTIETLMESSPEFKLEVDQVRAIWDITAEPELEVDADAAWQKVSSQVSETIPSIQDQKEPSTFWIQALAAAVLVTIGITVAMLFINDNGLRTLESGNQFAQVTLSDGTIVSLDAGSSLSYPEKFERNIREVSVEGVGFFQVTSDKEHPFIVHTNGGDVRVVGTAFEVNTREIKNTLLVEVEEGIVEVSTPEADLSQRVTAGESCTLNSEANTIEVNEILDPAAFYWKSKTIKFKRTQLSSVVQTLHDVLAINVSIGSEAIEGCELTATFKNETPDSILGIIAATLNLTLEKTADGFLLTGEGC